MFIKISKLPNLWRVKYLNDAKFIKAFGINLRRLRLQKNFSQEYLADEAGIPTNQVGRIERGEVNTSISTVNALAKALKIDIADLFKL